MNAASVSGSKRILYVDDEKGLALLGEELLGDLGFQVTAAFSGEEALELFKDSAAEFQLVVTDESMPGMTGIELATQIYQLAPEIPVIICSGHLLSMHEKGMEQANIKAVLMKTDICGKLPELLEQLLN